MLVARATAGQFLSPRVTLLIFALAVGGGILAASRVLIRPAARASSRPSETTESMGGA
jgi:hypothetical protein